MKVFFVLLLAICHQSCCVTYDDVVVSVKNGLLKGKVVYGNEKPYEAFLGVPYAKPPVHDLRFCSPVPCDPWSHTYDATYARSECLQKFYYVPHSTVKGDEDCLYLNIYRPCRRNPKEKLPVLVYFSFGAFATDFTSPENLSPVYFMDTEKVIVVVLQSRLGVFGYLSSGDEHCPGNFGLKDQALALRWLHENLEAFQGDPNCVTLLCAGNGAAACQYHWLNRDTSKLFHKVVLKSGNLDGPWALLDHPYQQFLHHAELAGVMHPQKLSTYELTETLRKADAKLLLTACDKFDLWSVDEFVHYRPVVEVDCKEAYMTKNPKDEWRHGHFDPKPLYVTFTHSDGNVRSSLLLDERQRYLFNQNVDENLSALLKVDPKHMKEVKNLYFKGQSCKLTDKTFWTYVELFTMRLFHQSVYNTVKNFVKNVNTQKYPLSIDKFNFNGPYHFTKLFSGYDVNLNTGFCDDLLYLFGFPSLFPYFDRSSIDYQMKNIYVDSHVNFAKTGVANTWSQMDLCDTHYFGKYGFCEYQVFDNQTEYVHGVLHNQATVDTTNYFPLEQVHLWNSISPN